MDIKYQKDFQYRFFEETKIVTNGGAIVQAQDLELGRNVCVKQVKIIGNNESELDDKYKQAMLEVKAMVRISEKTTRIPYVISTHFDKENSTLYIIMQWIFGTSLRDKMGVPELQFILWMIELCETLAIMERQRIYHKDIKPSNIMINERNELFLIDFNISVSAPNTFEGTLHYKAPEVDTDSKYMGRDKVDIFAIGVMLYEYYTKEVPKKSIEYANNRRRGNFEWDTFVEPMKKQPNVPMVMNNIIIKCMKLDPKQRFRNSNDLKNELRAAERSIRYGNQR